MTEIDGRSAEGRFCRHLEAELTAHVGGNPTIVQKLLIDRMIKIRLQLDLLDDRLKRGEWNPHDSRTYGGLIHALRLTGRELGLKSAAAKPPSLADHLARRAAEREGSAV